jgi:hypothetical protein
VAEGGHAALWRNHWCDRGRTGKRTDRTPNPEKSLTATIR